MKWLWNAKDGGPESRVWCWGLECKWAFSVLLLKFEQGSREAFHSHAFNAVSWIISGALYETIRLACGNHRSVLYTATLRPIFTPRDRFHKVYGLDPVTWVITFRGPWVNHWLEATPAEGTYTLTHGRKRIAA